MRMTSANRTSKAASTCLPPLANGDRMKQPEFHRRYLECPVGEKWELVGGIVYMASPLSLSNSDYDSEVGLVLRLYRVSTPGVQILHGATTILGEKSEPQPDLGLRIRPEFKGRSRTEGDYVKGPPELLVEIAHSTRAMDLHQKRADYQTAGVLEYLVVCNRGVRTALAESAYRPSAAPGRRGHLSFESLPGPMGRRSGLACLGLGSRSSGPAPRLGRTVARGVRAPA
jgi:Uma2 family endonuclease